MKKQKQLLSMYIVLGLFVISIECMEKEEKTKRRILSVASAPAETKKRYPSIEDVISADEKAKESIEDLNKVKKIAASFPDEVKKRTQSDYVLNKININIFPYLLVQKAQSEKNKN